MNAQHSQHSRTATDSALYDDEVSPLMMTETVCDDRPFDKQTVHCLHVWLTTRPHASHDCSNAAFEHKNTVYKCMVTDSGRVWFLTS